jgi:hypothetical protein
MLPGAPGTLDLAWPFRSGSKGTPPPAVSRVPSVVARSLFASGRRLTSWSFTEWMPA